MNRNKVVRKCQKCGRPTHTRGFILTPWGTVYCKRMPCLIAYGFTLEGRGVL